MKNFLRIGLRLVLFLLLLGVCVLVSWLVFVVAFIALREMDPRLKQFDILWYHLWSFLLLCLVALALFVWSLTKPVFYLLAWLKQLAQGNYQEPPRSNWLGRPVTGERIRAPYSFYKEIINRLSILTRVLQQTENDRRELDENRKNWIAGVRHDLKTPLAYIRGYSSMIAAVEQYNWSSVEIQQFGSLIEQKTVDVEQLIEDMNASYQLDNGGLPLHRQPTEIVEFTRGIVAELAGNPAAEACSFAFETEGGPQELNLDRRLIERALHNLLWNAVVHNPAGSHIQTELRCTPQGVEIMIRDNGQGIGKEVLERWNATEQDGLLSARTRLSGSGLGMGLAKDFVTRHGGTMTVQSGQQRGTEISIYLPA